MDCFLCSYSWYDSKYGQQIDAVLVDMTPFGYYRGVLLSAFRENNQVVSAIVQTFKTLDEYSQQLAKGCRASWVVGWMLGWAVQVLRNLRRSHEHHLIFPSCFSKVRLPISQVFLGDSWEKD